jgi:hypothetical protein
LNIFRKNAKGTQIDENTRKRKKPEELSNVDPDSTMWVDKYDL